VERYVSASAQIVQPLPPKVPRDLATRQREYAQFAAAAEWLSSVDRQLCDGLLPQLADLWNAHYAERMDGRRQITLIQSSAINFTDFFVADVSKIVASHSDTAPPARDAMP
jgi:hypothetical protein